MASRSHSPAAPIATPIAAPAARALSAIGHLGVRFARTTPASPSSRGCCGPPPRRGAPGRAHTARGRLDRPHRVGPHARVARLRTCAVVPPGCVPTIHDSASRIAIHSRRARVFTVPSGTPSSTAVSRTVARPAPWPATPAAGPGQPPQRRRPCVAQHRLEHLVLRRGRARPAPHREQQLRLPVPSTQRVHQTSGRDRPHPAHRASTTLAPANTARRATRQVRLLHHLGDQLVVSAPPAQPHRQPRRSAPVQLIERAAVSAGDPPNKLSSSIEAMAPILRCTSR